MSKELASLRLSTRDGVFDAEGLGDTCRRTVRANLLGGGRPLARLLAPLWPLRVWPVRFPAGTRVDGVIKAVPRARLGHVAAGHLDVRARWSERPVRLLPLALYAPGLRMRLLPSPGAGGGGLAGAPDGRTAASGRGAAGTAEGTKHMRLAGIQRALTGGAAAMAVITVLMTVSERLGLVRLNFGRLLGTAVHADGAGTRLLGWTLHVANGVGFPLAYRELFRRAGVSPGARHGAAAGQGHFGGAALFIALLLRVHPRPEEAGLRPFGPFAYGSMTVPGMLMGHVIYGAIVGRFLRGGASGVATAGAPPIASGGAPDRPTHRDI